MGRRVCSVNAGLSRPDALAPWKRLDTQCMTACLRLPTDVNLFLGLSTRCFLFNLTIKVMITKAIFELNACVNALYGLRTSSCALHQIYYQHLCCDRYEGMADRIFKARECYEMRDILRKATDQTAGLIYSTLELDAFIENYLKENNIIIPNKVADALVEYYRDTKNECRRCSICGKLTRLLCGRWLSLLLF